MKYLLSIGFVFGAAFSLLGQSPNQIEFTEYDLDLGDGILFSIEIKTQAGPQTMNKRISTVELNATIDSSVIKLN